jgi:hypothetical protein
MFREPDGRSAKRVSFPAKTSMYALRTMPVQVTPPLIFGKIASYNGQE